ncbi:Dyp-type peroxidase [Nostocoides sp. F2B08]|uniref:Dyp-type peroxidase n=1 Tax=Nostocoides sp. F2B08 TaxID=2653936 RepID=UPI001262EE26|nr:Dyp-type peroxidase [Tetrasphaera sp. F2B08]KAB7745996.1 Dyp-type peroxidase [Tetrasphaera sp. F2B08]
MTARIGRRRLVASIGAVAGASALGGCAGSGEVSPGSAATSAPTTRPFHGRRQSGVDDVPQAFAAWVALDLAPGSDRDTVRRLMSVWTDDIARLTAGRGTRTDLEPELAQRPSELTVTVGWGPGAFTAAGVAAPDWLRPLPPFAIDRLEDRWSGGDLVLQVAGECPVTLSHAVRRLVTGAAPMATQRWVQRGFRETGVDHGGQRMRNLFGQVDGTVNPDPRLADDEAIVWDDGSVWRRDATAMIVRRIAMDLDGWDRADRRSREHAVGRRLADGAPLTGGSELSPPDLEARGPDGFPVIDTFAHMRRAMPANPLERFLRRPYSYDDPPESVRTSDAGLVFVAFCADPIRQFLPVQERLAQADLMNLWTTPVGSAVFAVLPGCAAGELLGGDLLS